MFEIEIMGMYYLTIIDSFYKKDLMYTAQCLTCASKYSRVCYSSPEWVEDLVASLHDGWLSDWEGATVGDGVLSIISSNVH